MALGRVDELVSDVRQEPGSKMFAAGQRGTLGISWDLQRWLEGVRANFLAPPSTTATPRGLRDSRRATSMSR